MEIYSDDYITAFFAGNGLDMTRLGIKGCPLGSSRNGDIKQAVTDLLERTNMESKTNFTQDDLEISVKDWRNE